MDSKIDAKITAARPRNRKEDGDMFRSGYCRWILTFKLNHQLSPYSVIYLSISLSLPLSSNPLSFSLPLSPFRATFTFAVSCHVIIFLLSHLSPRPLPLSLPLNTPLYLRTASRFYVPSLSRANRWSFAAQHKFAITLFMRKWRSFNPGQVRQEMREVSFLIDALSCSSVLVESNEEKEKRIKPG